MPLSKALTWLHVKAHIHWKPHERKRDGEDLFSLYILMIFKMGTLTMLLYNMSCAVGAFGLHFCSLQWLVRHDGQRWENGTTLENIQNYPRLLQSHSSAVPSFSMLNCVIEYISFLTGHSSLFSPSSLWHLAPGRPPLYFPISSRRKRNICSYKHFHLGDNVLISIKEIRGDKWQPPTMWEFRN